MLASLMTWASLLALVAGAGVARAAVPLERPRPVPPEKTVFVSEYRGDPSRILARTPWGTLSEADLYLYLVMTGADDPLIVEKLRAALAENPKPGTAEADRLASLRTRLEEAVRDWAVVQSLANDAGSPAFRDPLDTMHRRMLLHPIQELVWVDDALLPEVRVLPADVAKHYAAHPEDAHEPNRITLRYILIRVSGASATAGFTTQGTEIPDTPAWESAVARLDAVRDDLLLGRTTFADAARKVSQASNAPTGGLAELRAGDFFPRFEREAQALDVGQLSGIMAGPEGAYLLEVESRIEGTLLPISAAAPAITKKLRLDQLHQRYNYELGRLATGVRYVNRAASVDALGLDAPVLEVGTWNLTKRQAWELFPDLVAPNFRLRKDLLEENLELYACGELFAEANLQAKRQNSPVLERAGAMADRLLLADLELHRLVDPQLVLTADQVYGYIRSHPDRFPLPPAPTVGPFAKAPLPAAAAAAKAQTKGKGVGLLGGGKPSQPGKSATSASATPKDTGTTAAKQKKKGPRIDTKSLFGGASKAESESAATSSSLIGKPLFGDVPPLLRLSKPGAPSASATAQERDPRSAFRELTAARFSLIEVRLRNKQQFSLAQIASERARLRQALELARDRASSVTLAQAAAVWPTLDTHPADVVPETIESALRLQAAPLGEIVRWSSTEGLDELTSATRTRVEDVRRTFATWVDGKMRFLPILETADSLLLFYVEQPDYASPQIDRLIELPLRRIVGMEMDEEAIQSVRQRIASEGRVEILAGKE
jgi:hypothetical protein